MDDIRKRLIPRRVGDVLSRGADDYIVILSQTTRQNKSYTALELAVKSCEGNWILPEPKSISCARNGLSALGGSRRVGPDLL